MLAEEFDVDVIDREILDPQFRRGFLHRWIVQWPNGFALTYVTEAEACAVQARWRIHEGPVAKSKN